MTPLLEVCVDDAAGLAAAIEGGADRIELCAALDLGGLTPSPGLMALAAGSPVPVYAMIRPRGGDFVFGAAEVAQMLREIDASRAAGLAGVVLGASRCNGRLDAARLASLVAASAGLGRTLHRAFDAVPDPAEAVETAVSLGFERILSSGARRLAPDGIDRLLEIAALAAGRIAVMPGSGITAATVGPILARLRPLEIHASCRVEVNAAQPAETALGLFEARRFATSLDAVKRLKARLSEVYSPLER